MTLPKILTFVSCLLALACNGEDPQKSPEPLGNLSGESFVTRKGFNVGTDVGLTHTLPFECPDGRSLAGSSMQIGFTMGDVCGPMTEKECMPRTTGERVPMMGITLTNTASPIVPGTYEMQIADQDVTYLTALGIFKEEDGSLVTDFLSYDQRTREPIWTGSVTLDTVNEDDVSGSVDLIDSSGTPITGSFTALACAFMKPYIEHNRCVLNSEDARIPPTCE